MASGAGKGILGGRGERTALLIGLLATLAVLAFWVLDAFTMAELGLVNLRFRARGPKPTAAPVVVVAIDDESLNGWLDDNAVYHHMPDRWTWPRTVFAQAVDNLREAGAKVIAIDMVFSESSRLNPGQDQAFAQSVKRAGNVVLGYRFVDLTDQALMEGRKLETLIPGLADAAADSGLVNVQRDPDDFIRRMPLVDRTGLPNLDLAVYRRLQFGKPQPYLLGEQGDWLQMGDNRMPLPLAINYAGPARSFPTVSFHNVFYKDVPARLGGMGLFKGKVVYIGSTTEILHDNYPTPFAPERPMPGVEVHANTLDTLLTRQYFGFLPPWSELLLVLGLGALSSLLTFRMRSWLGAAAMLGLELGYALLCVLAFTQGRLLLPMAAPMAAVFVSFAALTAWRLVVEERRSREIRSQFSRYVSKAIVDELLKDPSKIRLGGEVKEVTILFSDVRGFTALSESMEAEAVVGLLNEYLTAMVDVVMANGGTLDKYVGDAVMAVWGSPLPDPEHRRKAATCAVQMMERLEQLRAKWSAEGRKPLDIGIGLNSGRVVAGNMGHLHYKMDYTVIGDDVNLAARLESANKELKSHVLISGSTYQGCADLVEVVAHPAIHVKGKVNAVEVFEVVGWKGKRADWARPLAS
jgi:adenylate cyclase